MGASPPPAAAGPRSGRRQPGLDQDAGSRDLVTEFLGMDLVEGEPRRRRLWPVQLRLATRTDRHLQPGPGQHRRGGLAATAAASRGGGPRVGRGIPRVLKCILRGRIPWNSHRAAAVRPFKPDSPEIAGPVLRPALGLFDVLVVVAGVHRKGHHQSFGRGAASCGAGRAFVMVLSCSSSSW